MGELRDRMERDLTLRGVSPGTRRIYLYQARRFAAHYGRSPEVLGTDEIKGYLMYLLQIEQASGGVAFYVDGQLVPLDVAPNWLDCLSMRDWAFDFLVWPDHSVGGQVEFVSFR